MTKWFFALLVICFTQITIAQTGGVQGSPVSPFSAVGCKSVGLLDQAKQMKAAVGSSNISSAGIHFARIGFAYLLGCESIEQDFEEAKYWLEAAARSKDVSAAHNIAWMYQNGLGVPRDEIKARTLYGLILGSSEVTPGIKKISRSNLSLMPPGPVINTRARINSVVGAPYSPFPDQGECQTSALLFIAKQMKAINGSQIVISAGSTYSKVGYAFLTGCGGLPKDLDQAKVWLDLASRSKDVIAIHNLAWMYQNGIYVEKDLYSARALYQQVQREALDRKDLLEIVAGNLIYLNADLPVETFISPQPLDSSTAKPALQTVLEGAVQLPSSSGQNKSSVSSSSSTVMFSGLGRKRALVIGNNNYLSVQPLANAAEDARSMAESLQNVGYQVTLRLDLNEKEMKAALRNFSVQVEGGDEVLFFFAGHGVQLGSSNYLLPVDITGENEAQVRDEAIQLQRILDDMSERKAKLTLAMIDACRDNPFKTVGRAIGGRGLAPTTAATGQMVIFSAGTGQQALDRLGPTDKSKNGLFTRIFIKEMQKPGLSVDRVLRNVRNEVVELAKSVGHEQVPAIYDQVVGDFYFRN